MREAWSRSVQRGLQFSGLHPNSKNPEGSGSTRQRLLWNFGSVCKNLPFARQEAQTGDQGQEEEPQPSLERDLPI